MVLGQRLSVCFFFVIGLIVGGMNDAQASMPVPAQYGRDMYDIESSYFRLGRNPSKAMQDLEAANNISKMIEQAEQNAPENILPADFRVRQQEIQADLDAFQAERARLLNHPADQPLDAAALRKVNADIYQARKLLRMRDNNGADSAQAHARMIEQLKKQRARLLGADGHSAQIGSIVGRGIGGKTWDSFGFQQADGFVDGIQKGLMIRATEALGEAISSKLKTTIELVLGGTWDFMLLSGLDLWEDMCKVLFHDSKDPFKTKEVNGWKKLISEAMEQIEKNVKDGPKDSFRGHDMTQRNLFEIDEKEQIEATNSLNAWRMYVVGCAEQFDYFIFVLDSRKQYYKKDDIICFYADQIQNRLSDYRALMLKAGSVKELDEFIESNKSLLPAMRKNIEQLFIRLAEEVEPRTLGLGGNGDSMRRTDTTARIRPSGLDDDMPNRFSNGWGG
ncbi:hypothetical protein JST56_01600 [Candidatus Dependentiae bacterium]|jgi:hypothetical protein|nr:hypothetical protein [Candidatus Dependentiae bacterium]